MRGNTRSVVRASTAIASIAVAMTVPSIAYAQIASSADRATAPSTSPDQPGEIIVTAQKRSESINSVGMSISAVTGDQLVRKGIVDTAQLVKVIPGFNFTETGYATPVYTIRGVGFQENSLAASPAVSVYVDEVPLPYPTETEGVGLDLERVEVLKGPQGTLYGENSTGGAVNYIAAKPTRTFQAGFDGSYGRFNTADLQGFVSGPITDTLGIRISMRSVQGSDWQYSYTRSDSNGAQNRLLGRILLDWNPDDRLRISVNMNGWRDKSDTPAAQIVGVYPQTTAVPLFPGVATYPLAPGNDRAADWDAGQTLRRNNSFYQGSLRIDYSLADNLKLTSITSYESYHRDQPFDSDGTNLQIFRVTEGGHINTIFQEIRVSGNVSDRFNWIVGGNYQSDKTFDSNYIQFIDSTSRLSLGLPSQDSVNRTRQNVETKAVYGNAEYKILPDLTLQGGIRYTSADRDFAGCSQDAGDGYLAAIYTKLRSVLGYSPTPVPVSGGCVTVDTANHLSELIVRRLDQHNVSWRGGLNWKAGNGILLYANVSRGYKSGSFPTLSATYSTGFTPVTQESILAYEAGFKLTLIDRKLQLNGAGFYYDYTNKQIRGKIQDPLNGALSGLVNVPRSHIAGFELSAVARPFPGLTISPSVTLVQSRIDRSKSGDFYNYTLVGTYGDFTGEAFPYTPKWSGNVDAEYEWRLKGAWNAFLGGNVSYQSHTNGGFGDLPIFNIKGYALLDLRAGVETEDGKWRVSLFGHNVANEYYWTSASKLVDTVTRFTGMPATYGISLGYRYK